MSSKAQEDRFPAAMERFLHTMSAMEPITQENVTDAISELCEIMRVAKAVTSFYDNEMFEQLSDGRVVVGYDNGKPCRAVATRRMVTSIMTVIVCEVYMAYDEPDWSAEERQRADLVMSMIQTFVSRSRLQKVVDRLTYRDDDGYPNVRSYLRYMERMGRAGRLRGKAAVHFNLKHFSLVNQQIGRGAGDIVMHSFFEGLEKIIGDTEEDGILCRQGGDNFVAIVRQERLGAVLDYLKGTAIGYDARHAEERVKISATVGVYCIPPVFQYHNPSDVMDKVMPTIQAARSSTVTDVVFYDDKMIVSKEKVMRVQSLFPSALETEEFQVFYQPKVSVTTGKLAGAEALCRWFHNGEMICPDDFIPVLEQGMEICRLDFYMLDHVCRDIRRWLDEGRDVVRISVNLSRKHMMDYDLLNRLIEIVDRHSVPHGLIEIELTETTTDVEFLDLKRVVSGLQRAGICTSVDDFGIGYSSLNLIKEIPWNVLKVDRCFLPEDGEAPDSRRNVMFKYVVAMAREMGLECITEGVETAAQVEMLKANACDLAQGYFFDRPMPAAEFEQRLQQMQLRNKVNI